MLKYTHKSGGKISNKSTFEVAPVGGIPHRYGCRDDAEPHPLK